SSNIAQSSPWLSLWFRPRDTIERILATNPARHVILLAVLSAMADIVVPLIGEVGLWSALLDWRIIIFVVFAGAATGILGLYVGAWLMEWLAKPLSGRASSSEI